MTMDFLYDNVSLIAVIAGVLFILFAVIKLIGGSLTKMIRERTSNPNPPQPPQQAPAQTPAQQATPATNPTPAPATPTRPAIPPASANATSGTLVPSSAITGKTWWVTAIIGFLILVFLSFWPIIPLITKYIFVVPLIVLILGRLVLIDFLTIDPTKAREKMLKLVSVASFVGILIYLGHLAVNYVPEAEAQGIGTKIGAFFTPVPPAEKKWKGEKIITAPVAVGDDWSQVPVVDCLPWAIERWRLTALCPFSQGKYEMMAEGWDKPFSTGGNGDSVKPPQHLPNNLDFKVRSLEKEPMTFRIEWR